jgi:hypothetical protein
MERTPLTDPQFEALMPKLTAEAYDRLEKKILKEGFREPLIVWKEQNILLDGHNRLSICKKHNIEYHVETVSLKNRNEALQWIVDHQLGRRNLTDQQRAYYIGKDYLLNKLPHGDADRFTNPARGQSVTLGETSIPCQNPVVEAIAEKYDVSTRTVKRDAEFAQAVDQLPEEEKEKVLSGQSGLSKQEVIEAAPKRCPSCDRKARVGQEVPKSCHDCNALNPPKLKLITGREPGSDNKGNSGTIPSQNGKPVFKLKEFVAKMGEAMSLIDRLAGQYGQVSPKGVPAGQTHRGFQARIDAIIADVTEWEVSLKKAKAK